MGWMSCFQTMHPKKPIATFNGILRWFSLFFGKFPTCRLCPADWKSAATKTGEGNSRTCPRIELPPAPLREFPSCRSSSAAAACMAAPTASRAFPRRDEVLAPLLSTDRADVLLADRLGRPRLPRTPAASARPVHSRRLRAL